MINGIWLKSNKHFFFLIIKTSGGRIYTISVSRLVRGVSLAFYCAPLRLNTWCSPVLSSFPPCHCWRESGALSPWRQSPATSEARCLI